MRMAGLLWALIVIVFGFWMLGFALHVAGSMIHLLLVVCAVLLLVNLLSGRGARI
jgi:hypothetical protein